MEQLQFCTQCGTPLGSETQFCKACGADPTRGVIISPAPTYSKKSGKTALIYCILFGIFGAHRFYVGKTRSGFLSLITTGFLGIWTAIDLIALLRNKFTDINDLPLETLSSPSKLKQISIFLCSLVLWVVLTLVLLISTVTYLTKSLVDIVNNQISAIQEGDMKKAYSYTSKDFQKLIPFNHFKEYLNQLPYINSSKTTDFNERSIDMESGFLSGTLTSKDGVKTPIKYFFIKEEGQWKILIMPIPVLEKSQ